MDRVTDRMRPENRLARSVSIHASSSALRFPGDRRMIPLRNSPKLTALMNNVSRFCAATHVLTLGSGWGRTNSDGTLVSNRKPLLCAPRRLRMSGFLRERWYPTESRSFKIDGASKGGGSAKERVDFFIREQAPHLGACIDQFLTRAPTRQFGGNLHFANDDLFHIGAERQAASRGLGEEAFLDLGLKVKGDGHGVLLCKPCFSPTAPPYSALGQVSRYGQTCVKH